MAALHNIEQLIALYFEADRTWVRERYVGMFGQQDADSGRSQEQEPTPDGEEQSEPQAVSEADLRWRRGIDPGAWAEALFDAQLGEVRGQLQASEEITNPVIAQWELMDLPQRIVAVDSMSQLADSNVPVFQAMANMQRSFGTRAAAPLCHAFFPDDAFPIQDEMPFGKLAAILDLLGIALPSFDDKTEFEIWWALSEAVRGFQTAHRLEPWQMWAAIFDLGPRLLPPPTEFPNDPPPRVWVVATNDKLGEFAEIDAHSASDIGDWAINAKAQRGDLVLMYCVAPRSAVVSAYRVLCDAYRDPFGGWNGYRAEIGHKIAVPWITFSEMKADQVLKDWVLVRRNFQGLLQFEVTQDAWGRIKELVGAKDPNIKAALDQYTHAAKGVREIKVRGEGWSEADVEREVVIPALAGFGWRLGTNLASQVPMRIKVGSGPPKGVFADFVGYAGAMTSEVILVVEVKRRIASQKDLERAAEQAESYAGKLCCTRYVVASPEGFWVYELTFPGQSRPIATFELTSNHLEQVPSGLECLIGFEALQSSAAASRH